MGFARERGQLVTMARTYTRDEADEIFRRAAQRSGHDGEPNLSREDLLEAARDVGIDADAIHRAAEEVEIGIMPAPRLPSEGEAVDAWIARRRRRLFRHASVWLVICAGLLAINLLAGGALWFQWPLVSWGIVVALHAIGALGTPSPEQVERVKQRHRKKMQSARKKLDAEQRQLEKRRAQAERKRTRDRRQESAAAFEAAVEEGVAALMNAATRTLNEVSRRARPVEKAEPPEKRETDFDRYVAQKKREASGQRVPLRVDVPAERERLTELEDEAEDAQHEAARRARR